MIGIKKGVRSPYADKVDHLIKTTLMTNPEIAAEVGVDRGYVQNRRRCLRDSSKTKPKPVVRKIKYSFKRYERLLNQVFAPVEIA